MQDQDIVDSFHGAIRQRLSPELQAKYDALPPEQQARAGYALIRVSDMIDGTLTQNQLDAIKRMADAMVAALRPYGNLFGWDSNDEPCNSHAAAVHRPPRARG